MVNQGCPKSLLGRILFNIQSPVSLPNLEQPILLVFLLLNSIINPENSIKAECDGQFAHSARISSGLGGEG